MAPQSVHPPGRSSDPVGGRHNGAGGLHGMLLAGCGSAAANSARNSAARHRGDGRRARIPGAAARRAGRGGLHRMAAAVRRAAVQLTVDGVPGVWLAEEVATIYARVVGRELESARRRHPDAIVPPALLIAQHVLSSAGGTKLVPEATGDGDSSRDVEAAVFRDGPRRCGERLSVRDAASLACITPRAVRKAIASGRLSASRQGRDWEIDPAELQDFQRKRARNGCSG